MIHIENITKTYAMGDGAVHALRGVSLDIREGEFVSIMGASGCGKSTLLHILGLLDIPDSGVYSLFGQDVMQLEDNALAGLRNKGIGFVFQHFNLLARATALENVDLPMLYSPKKTDEPFARRLLQDLGLGARLSHRPNQLSGGQQQRVAIARALVNRPRLILADEPTGNLDSVSSREILEELRRLNGLGMTIVMVTHDAEIARHARRIVHMKDGVVQSDESNPGPTPEATAQTKTPLDDGGRPHIWMEIPHHFKQAWRALTANITRTILSALGILIGVSAVIAMLAIGTGARESIETQLSTLGSNLLMLHPGARSAGGVRMEAGSVTRFTVQDQTDLQQNLPQAKQVSGTVQGRCQTTFGNKNWNTRVVGAMPEFAAMHNVIPVAGRFFSLAEVRQRARVAALGPTVIRELFGDQNPLGEYVKINKVNFTVIGILPEKGSAGWQDQDDWILIPLSTAMYRLLGREYVDTIEVEVARAEDMPEAEDAIRNLIIRNHHLTPSQTNSFTVRNMAEIRETISETSRTMAFLLSAIAAVSLLVGGVGIMNIMLVSVTERTREIGLRKALGARRKDVMAQFLTEAVVISLAGGALGIALGTGISFTVSQLAGWPVVISWYSIALASGFSALIGILFGIWPARKAARLNPINALRYE